MKSLKLKNFNDFRQKTSLFRKISHWESTKEKEYISHWESMEEKNRKKNIDISHRESMKGKIK